MAIAKTRKKVVEAVDMEMKIEQAPTLKCHKIVLRNAVLMDGHIYRAGENYVSDNERERLKSLGKI